MLDRNAVRGSAAAAGIVITAGLISSCAGGVSTTPSGTTATAGTAAPSPTHKAAAATVGSYFDAQDASGDTYRVTLVKVIDPAQGSDQFNTPDQGKRFAAAVFSVKALKGSPQDEDADNDAALVGSNGQTYTADFDSIEGYTDFNSGTIQAAQGDTTVGAVNFQVPDGVKVAKIQWTEGSGSTVQWNVRS